MGSVYASVKEPADAASLLKELQRPGHSEPTTIQRTELISTLVGFLDSTTDDTYPIIASLKLLGRTPVGTDSLVAALPSLLKHSGLTRAAELAPDPPAEDPLQESQKEALRCVCNTLLLHASARDSFRATLAREPSWTKGLVKLLDVPSAGFLAGRLLFLLSSKHGKHIDALVDETDALERMSKVFRQSVKCLQEDVQWLSAGTAPTPADTLKEQLKAAYNLMLFYARSHQSSQTKSTMPALGVSAPGEAGELNLDSSTRFRPLFQPVLQLAVLLPAGNDPKDPSALLRSAFHALLVFPITLEELDGFEYSWSQDVDAYVETIQSDLSPLPPLADRLYQLFESVSRSLLPPNSLPTKSRHSEAPADVDELVPRGTGDSTRIDDILAPMILLLRKLSLLTGPGEALKDRILPKNFDRSIPPERHRDVTGTLVRLMSSIMLPNSAFAAGELLYSLCGNSAEALSLAIGYGNASGFLQNRGELIAPPSHETDDSGRPNQDDLPDLTKQSNTFPTKQNQKVNPITGAYDKPEDESKPKMTDEEKEREAERLFVLFDRMKKTGVIDIDNPVVQAKQKGDLEQTKAEREAELKEASEREAREEKEAMEELRRYKERKAAASHPSS